MKDGNHAEENQEPSDISRVSHFKEAFSNGMKGDSIFFDVVPAEGKVKDLTFKGWWYCGSKLESITMGPDGSFPLKNGVTDTSTTWVAIPVSFSLRPRNFDGKLC